VLPDDPDAGDRPALDRGYCSTALSYSLAVNATELLTETLFLAGLIPLLWLLVRAGRNGIAPTGPASAGHHPGHTCSVTLSRACRCSHSGMVWFGLSATRTHGAVRCMQAGKPAPRRYALIIGPWSIRNTIHLRRPDSD
jgi:hypothetical protein